MIKYTVYCNDEYYVFESSKRMATEEIASFLGCDIDEIVQVDFE